MFGYIQFLADVIFALFLVIFFLLWLAAEKNEHHLLREWRNAFQFYLAFGGLCFLGTNIGWIAGSADIRSATVALILVIGFAIAAPIMSGVFKENPRDGITG